MADVKVERGRENATLLLAAAEAAGEPADVVRSTSKGYLVDEAIAKKAGVDYVTEEDEQKEWEERLAADNKASAEASEDSDDSDDAAPRKRAARKTATKKAASKTAAPKE